MANFISESIKELEHVVWPTDGETRRYVQISVFIIVALALFLAFWGYIFSNGLLAVRSQFDHVTITNSDNTPATTQDLQNILQQFGTGMTQSGVTDSGATKTLTGTSTQSGVSTGATGTVQP